MDVHRPLVVVIDYSLILLPVQRDHLVRRAIGFASLLLVDAAISLGSISAAVRGRLIAIKCWRGGRLRLISYHERVALFIFLLAHAPRCSVTRLRVGEV